VDFAVAARARRLALFHHDPSRSDRAVDVLLARCRQRLVAPDAPEVFAAAEGQYLSVVRPGAPAATAGPVVLATAEQARPLHATTVLIADDDPDVMSVIVLDWMMPGLDGLSVCRALRQDDNPRLARIPVVLITGRADAQDTAAGFTAGVTDYLTKPFKPTHLLARLQSWLLRSQRE
jgi:CheY-like chemotaxis protein